MINHEAVQRLRKLRVSKGYETQKGFCRHAHKQGYEIVLRRYGAIERGDVKPDINEIIDICNAMKISADAWLIGAEKSLDVSRLSPKAIKIVENLVDSLAKL